VKLLIDHNLGKCKIFVTSQGRIKALSIQFIYDLGLTYPQISKQMKFPNKVNKLANPKLHGKTKFKILEIFINKCLDRLIKAQDKQDIVDKEITCLERDLKYIFEVLPISVDGFTKTSNLWSMPKKKIFMIVIGNTLLILREPLLVLTTLITSWLIVLFINAYSSGKIVEFTRISIVPITLLAMLFTLVMWLAFSSVKIYFSTHFKGETMLIKSSNYLRTLSQLSTLNLSFPKNSYDYAQRILEIERYEIESNDKKNIENAVIISSICFISLFSLSFASFIRSIIDLQSVIFGSTNSSPFNIQTGTVIIFSIFVFVYRYRFISWHAKKLTQIKY
jgi:hypothetical protein